MATYAQVDHDPFAAAAPTPPPADMSGAKLVPVDHDPFAASATAQPDMGADAIPSQRSMLGDVWQGTKTTAGNVIPSAAKFYGGLLQAIVHPVDTATTLSQLARGEALLATGLDYKEQPEKAKEIELAKTLNQVYKDRYGGWDNFVKTFQEDPVGVLGDVSTVLGLGGGAVNVAGKSAAMLGAAETGGKIASVGQKVAGVGEAINPVTLPFKGPIKSAVKGAYNVIEPYIPGGEQARLNKVFREIGLYNDIMSASGERRLSPDIMNQIASRAEAGQSIDQIAYEMRLPSLASAAAKANAMGTAGIQRLYAENAATRDVTRANQLAGAEEAVGRELGNVNALGVQNIATAQQALSDARVMAAGGEPPLPNDVLSRLEGAKQSTNQLMTELEQKRMAEAGTLPSLKTEAQGAKVTDSIAKAKESVTKSKVDPVYDELRAQSVGLKTDVTPIYQAAADEMGTALGQFDPSMLPAATAKILRKFQGKATKTGTGFMGLTGTSTKFETPMAEVADLIDLRKALNADYARTAKSYGDPAQATKLAALAKMQNAIDDVFANSTTLPDSVKLLADEARSAYKTNVGDVFKTGEESKALLSGNLGSDRLVATFFNPNNLDATQQMARMVKDNPAAKSQLSEAIANAYRKQVVKDGVIDPTAHARFLSKNEDNIRILRDAGVNFTNIDLRTLPATVYPRMASDISETSAQIAKLQNKLGTPIAGPVPKVEGGLPGAQKTVAEVEAEIAARKAAAAQGRGGLVGAVEARATDLAEAKQAAKAATSDLTKFKSELSSLREKVGVPAHETVADIVSDIPEAKQIAAEVRKALDFQLKAGELATMGSKLNMPLLTKYQSLKIPTDITTEIIVNNTLQSLSKNTNTRLAQRIALAMLTPESLAQAMSAAAKGNLLQRGGAAAGAVIKGANTLAPSAVNALLNNQSANGAP
jgi:hypothetical protein